MISEGLVLIERFGWSPDLEGRCDASVLSLYRGFDGIWWPGSTFSDIADVAPVSRLSDFSTMLSKGSSRLDLLYLGSLELPLELSQQFEHRGFDLGYIDSRDNYYSVLLHEVLCGTEASLRQFSTILNSSCLLVRREHAEHITEHRRSLDGFDTIEAIEEPIVAIPVFGWRA